MCYSRAWSAGISHPCYPCTASLHTQTAVALPCLPRRVFHCVTSTYPQAHDRTLRHSSSRSAAAHEHSTQRLHSWHRSCSAIVCGTTSNTTTGSSSSSSSVSTTWMPSTHLGRCVAANAAASSANTTSRSSSRVPEMCVIVDEHNNLIGAATRHETVSKRLLGRGAYVLVFNSTGQLFVSRRSLSKDCYPGCLDVTISGVVNYGEEYADTAVRELQEEIGMPLQDSSSSVQQLFIFLYKDATCHVFGCAFKVTWDGPITFADAEVEWGRFMPMQELQQMLQQNPEQFTPVGRHILGLYVDQQQQQQ